ncbi:MAG: 2-C-methyl-D-erythritol 4-phosphate cytidylyltransferase, partial [Limnobacter sp.]|nr:2-C-methyl-D-erythritol 4-phosphate cytidylyltransferase [Limnobacter sp.]
MALTPKYFGLIPAGGVGKRFGAAVPKQYARINGRTLLEHAADALLADDRVVKVFVVASEDDDMAPELFSSEPRVQVIPKAGKERVNTVLNGLNYLLEQMLVSETD